MSLISSSLRMRCFNFFRVSVLAEIAGEFSSISVISSIGADGSGDSSDMSTSYPSSFSPEQCMACIVFLFEDSCWKVDLFGVEPIDGALAMKDSTVVGVSNLRFTNALGLY